MGKKGDNCLSGTPRFKERHSEKGALRMCEDSYLKVGTWNGTRKS